MHSFKDTAGRHWSLAINVATIKRVRDLVGVNLLTVADNRCELLTRLYDDPILLVDVLYSVLKPDADKQEITDEQFGEALAGDCIFDASEALVGELVDFFPDPRRRAALTQILEKIKTVGNRLMEHAAAELASVDPEAVANKCIASAFSSRASSESSPGDSP